MLHHPALRFATALLVIVLFSRTCSANVPASQLHVFDFLGWSHAAIAGGGQVFQDVHGDIDMTVTATGTHPITSSRTANGILTGRDIAGSHSFQFVFSEPLTLMLEVQTVDTQEVVHVISESTAAYAHQFGAAAQVTHRADGLSLTGTAFGISPTGAAMGQITTYTDRLTLNYETLADVPKFERFRLAAVVPEPSGLALGGIGLLGLLFARRRPF